MRNSEVINQELQQRLADQQALVDGAVNETGEKRALTQEENTKFDAAQTEVNSLRSELKRSLEHEENLRSLAAKKGKPLGGKKEPEEKKIKRNFSITKAINAVKSGKALEGLEAEMHQEAEKETRDAGVKRNAQDLPSVSIPSWLMRADAQTVTEDSANYGGFAVVDQAPRAVKGFSPALFIEQLGATRYSGLVGGDVPIPVFNDYAFGWYAETAAVPNTKNTIQGPTLSPNRVACNVGISNRWLAQAATGDAMVMQSLRNGYDNALNTAAINGPGTSNQPLGILNTTGIGESVILTSAGPATWAQMVELPGLVNAANASMNSRNFLLSPQLAAALKGITRDSGSGRYLMEGNTIDGVNAYTTSLVPTLSSNKVLIYGDFSALAIGEWGGVTIQLDPYTNLDSNKTRAIVNAHADVAIAQPGAFAVNKFINS